MEHRLPRCVGWRKPSEWNQVCEALFDEHADDDHSWDDTTFGSSEEGDDDEGATSDSDSDSSVGESSNPTSQNRKRKRGTESGGKCVGVHEMSKQDVARKQQAVSVMESWGLRTKLPLSVECTASLVSTLLQDPHFNPASTAPLHLVRMAYSLSIVRFVNGLCDDSQKGLSARPIAYVASELGIPEHIVDIRHQATHTVLPTLSALRAAAPHVVDWLRRNYWMKQANEMKRAPKKISKLIAKFRSHSSIRFLKLSQASTQSRNEKMESQKIAGEASSAADLIVREIVSCVPANALSTMLLSKLLLVGTLIPRAEGGAPLRCSDTRMAKAWSVWSPALSHFDTIWPHFSGLFLFEILERIRALFAEDEASGVFPQKNNVVPTGAFAVKLQSSQHGKSRSNVQIQTEWLSRFALQALSSYSVDTGTMQTLLQTTMNTPCRTNQPFLELLLSRLGGVVGPIISAQLLNLFELGSGFPQGFNSSGAPLEKRRRYNTLSSTDDDNDKVTTKLSQFSSLVDAFVSEANETNQQHNPHMRHVLTNVAEVVSASKGEDVMWKMTADSGWIGRPIGVLADGTTPDFERVNFSKLRGGGFDKGDNDIRVNKNVGADRGGVKANDVISNPVFIDHVKPLIVLM